MNSIDRTGYSAGAVDLFLLESDLSGDDFEGFGDFGWDATQCPRLKIDKCPVRAGFRQDQVVSRSSNLKPSQ